MIFQGDLVPDGTSTVDIYFGIDAKAKQHNLEPIAFCVPNEGSQEYTSGPYVCNFASECQPVGVVDLMPKLVGINVAALRKCPKNGQRRGFVWESRSASTSRSRYTGWTPSE